MSDQPAPGGLAAPPAPTDRIFFALMPEGQAAEKAEAMALALGAAHGAKPRSGAKEKFHITLFHVGDFVGLPDHEVSQACRVADGLRAEPFDVRLDRLGSFSGSPRRKPYVLLTTGSDRLMAFQAEMQTRMLRAGLTQGRQHPTYTPHLTLLYGHQPLEERPVEPLTWTAREFVLIRSLIGRGVYEHFGRWALLGPGRDGQGA